MENTEPNTPETMHAFAAQHDAGNILRLFELSPNPSTEELLLAAWAYQYVGQYEKAITTAELAVAKGNSIESVASLANAYTSANRFEEADQILGSRDVSDIRLAYERVRLEVARRQWENVPKYLERVEFDYSRDVDFKAYATYCYLRVNPTREAIDELMHLDRIGSETAAALLMMYYAEIKAFKKSASWAEHALVKRPGDYNLYSALYAARYNNGEFEAALQVLDIAKRLFGRREELVTWEASTSYVLKRYDMVVNLLLSRFLGKPSRKDWGMLAESLLRTYQFGKFLKCYVQCINKMDLQEYEINETEIVSLRSAIKTIRESSTNQR